MTNILHIDARDSVAVALTALDAGTVVTIDDTTVTLRESITPGHKFAVRDIEEGESVYKYGYPIGVAKSAIAAGSWVHSHNLRSGLDGECEYTYAPEDPADPTTDRRDTFLGYARASGAAGVRNEVWIIPTVGCVNKIADRIADLARSRVEGFIDGLYAFAHPYGCSQMDEDQENTRQFLANLARNGNAGGVLFLSLGCENCGMGTIEPYLGDYDHDRIRFLVCQDVEDEVAAGVRIVEELAAIAGRDRREPLPLDRLIIGLNCGGSDGFSGITANPLAGRICDRHTAAGGCAVLTEVPEMFGAEQILMERCVNRDVFDKTVRLINDYKNYYISHNQPVSENPSPGNKAGGITTLEEKSLGCVQKGGTAVVTDVLDYGDTAVKPGLNLLNGPGNDIVAITNLTAAGCHLILFTTGRGTPLGAPVPTLKIATNSSLAAKKSHWIDFDAQQILEHDCTEELWAYVKAVAEGKESKNEQCGYREIAIFKDGVTL